MPELSISSMEQQGSTKTVIQFIIEFFLLMELRNLARKGDFKFVSPRTVLVLLEQLGNNTSFKERHTHRLWSRNRMYEGLLLRIWEKSALEAQHNAYTKNKWLQVMGVCNSLLCSMIPEGTRDSHLTYLRDILPA